MTAIARTWVRSFSFGLALAVPLAAQQPTQLTFGVYSFKRPTEVAKDFFVVTDELTRLCSAECGRPVAIQLKIFKTYDECLDALVAGSIDIVRFGPASYVLAKRRNAEVQLLAAEQETKPGQRRAEGIIAVRSDSPVQTLADLKGKSFAFGDENSTIGRYLSQAQLVKAGVRSTDLQRFEYLDRHDKVFKAVEVGDFVAGAMHVTTFDELNGEKKPLRAIARFENLGKPWIARAGLDAATCDALRRSLLAMKDEKVLKALKVFGFQAATDETFDLIREGMKKSAEFERPAATPKPDKD